MNKIIHSFETYIIKSITYMKIKSTYIFNVIAFLSFGYKNNSPHYNYPYYYCTTST